jgi:enterochelin esterase-like enzyme
MTPPGRQVWSLPPLSGKASWAAIFLDAELYLERVDVVPVLHQLQETGSIPPMQAVFVSSNDAVSRHSDYVMRS